MSDEFPPTGDPSQGPPGDDQAWPEKQVANTEPSSSGADAPPLDESWADTWTGDDAVPEDVSAALNELEPTAGNEPSVATATPQTSAPTPPPSSPTIPAPASPSGSDDDWDANPTPISSQPTTPQQPVNAGTPMPAGLSVPDFPGSSKHIPLPSWPADEYGTISPISAEKLASSAVAPLVAAARGYRSVDQSQVKEAAFDLGFGDLRSGGGKTLKNCAESGEVLVIPFYDHVEVRRSVESGRKAIPTTNQFRPRVPVINAKTGKSSKYLFTPGAAIPLDVHPALPISWADNPHEHLISEGTLKTDSALTALLREAGITDQELAWPGDDEDPVAKMRSLMERVPQHLRVVMTSVAGVSNWHNDRDTWINLKLDGRTVLIAFDGDLDTNIEVWRQANKMFQVIERAKGDPAILHLSVPHSQGFRKVGLDDYLAEIRQWSTLAELIKTDLPEAPVHYENGSWRVNEERCVCEKFVVDENNPGGRWQEVHPIGGRLKLLAVRRQLSAHELERGNLDSDDVDGDDVHQYELIWRDPDGVPRRVVVEGPSDMSAEKPDRWHKVDGARLPSDLLAHPYWPPRKEGEEWLLAVKSHEPDQVEKTTLWDHGGWIPDSADGPVFIVGKQVIGANGLSRAVIPGITNNEVANIENLGVRMTNPDEDVEKIISDVLDVYGNVWADKRVGAAVIAAALRSVVPVPMSVPLLFTGGPRTGKSWSAAAVMAFWQPKERTWSEKSLPASANDTFAAIENSASRVTAPWVVDDLAPSADPVQARNDEAKIGDIIRAFANKTAKRRMTKEMKARPAPPMRGALIFTAENALSVQSVMDRVLHLPFEAGAIADENAMARLVAMRDQKSFGNPMPAITGLIIRYVAETAAERGWEEYYRSWTDIIDERREIAAGVMALTSKASRHIHMAVDLGLGIRVLQDYCYDVLENDELGDRLGAMEFDLYSLLADHNRRQRTKSLGRSTLEAVRSVLSTGKGHLTGLTEDGLPAEGEGSADVCRRLGWTLVAQQPPRPGGERLGVVMEKDSKLFALISPAAAFSKARSAFPELIPAGNKSTAAFTAMWTEGIAAGPWNREEDRPTVKVRVGGGQERLVPIPLDVLLGDLDLEGFDPEYDVQY